MFAKTSMALAILIALSSGALAAQKHHPGTATAQNRHSGAAAAYNYRPGAANAYSRSRSIDDLCRQTGPITLPATNPICNTKDFMAR